ncbi:MAG: hypothetical protein Kow00124_03560 [Anaerolineae bacterium]
MDSVAPFNPAPDGPAAVAPLTGNEHTEEWHWLGALISDLLSRHLAACIPTLDYNTTARAIITAKCTLPLDAAGVQSLRRDLNLHALIHGSYFLDEEGKILGLRLYVAGEDTPPGPLEVSTPLGSFAPFIARVSLAVLERLQVPIDDALREQVKAVARPHNFEAFRLVARARAAWSRGENELALTAVTSALTLDPGLEEAMLIEVSIARDAGDSATARQAFRRWIEHALKAGQIEVAAERLTMLGHWLAGRGEWPEARRAYEEARNLYRRINDEAGQARVANNLAHLDLLQGRIGDTIRSYRRSLRVFEGSPDAALDTAITYLNLGMAHKNQGQRDEALRAIEEAIARARDLKDTGLEAHGIAQRGALYADMGKSALASADYARAASLFDILGDAPGRAMVKCHQGLLERQRGMYHDAEALLLEALDLFEKQANPHEQAVICFNLADLYLAMGLYSQAWEYARDAFETFEGLKSGWAARAKELLDTLQELVEEAEEAPSGGDPVFRPDAAPIQTVPPQNPAGPQPPTGSPDPPIAPTGPISTTGQMAPPAGPQRPSITPPPAAPRQIPLEHFAQPPGQSQERQPRPPDEEGEEAFDDPGEAEDGPHAGSAF